MVGAAGTALAAAIPGGIRSAAAATTPLITRAIRSTGERIPVMGMGSFITFNVADGRRTLRQRVNVLQAFFDAGGGMVDSSPMYDSSEKVIGYCLKRVTDASRLFSATKVWTPSPNAGIRQMRNSERLWGEKQFDLFQVHNLLNWEAHLPMLQAAKDSGRVRYVGITTSHGRFHRRLEELMRREKFDFVQLTYNVLDREVEERLLPLAADRGIAVIVNRPFQREGLFSHVGHASLPGFASDLGCESWAQLFLKFVISHPAVTVAIPATRQVAHMRENMAAARGPLPDAAMRRRIIQAVERL